MCEIDAENAYAALLLIYPEESTRFLTPDVFNPSVGHDFSELRNVVQRTRSKQCVLLPDIDDSYDRSSHAL